MELKFTRSDLRKFSKGEWLKGGIDFLGVF
jgi:hypothetical protein